MRGGTTGADVRRRRRSHPFALLAGLTFSACLTSGCAAQAAAETTVPTTVMAMILAELAKRKDLQYSNGTHVDASGKKLPDKSPADQQDDRHRGLFVWRRATFYNKSPNPPSTTDLINKISDEFDDMKAVETKLIGTPSNAGPLRTAAPDGSSPADANSPFTCDADKHLDLINLATYQTGGVLDKSLHGRFQERRVRAAVAIIWRAAGIHPEMILATRTTNPFVNAPSYVNTNVLLELLDHRLRKVERMYNQMNSRAGDTLKRDGTSGKSWKDKRRVRPIEYPEFFFTPNAAALIDPSDTAWLPNNPDRFHPGAPPERLTFEWTVGTANHAKRRVLTRVGEEHNPTEGIDRSWGVLDQDYAYQRFYDPISGLDLSDAVEALLKPALNVWQRTWFYCDHTIATLHLDALLFGLMRRGVRQGKDGKAIFDGIPTNPITYIELGPILGGVPTTNTLSDFTTWKTLQPPGLTNPMFNSEAAGTWFQNLYLNPADLQVGDHVIFYNHIAYKALTAEAFGLENAIITELDSNQDNGGLHLKGVRLSGLGMGTPYTELKHAADLAEFAQEMADGVNAAIDRIHDKIENTPDKGGMNADERAANCFITSKGVLVFQWNPFTAGVDSSLFAPWFAFLPFDSRPPEGKAPYSVVWPDVPSMLRAVKHTFIDLTDARLKNHTAMPPSFDAFVVDPITKLTRVDANGQKVTKHFDLTKKGVLFPLYELAKDASASVNVFKQTTSWGKYFANRLAADIAQPPQTLATVFVQKFLISGTTRDDEAALKVWADIPGLFIPGAQSPLTPKKGPPVLFPVQVVRPTVRTTF